MPETEPLYPQAAPALAEQRRRLAPGPAEALRAFRRSVFAEGDYHDEQARHPRDEYRRFREARRSELGGCALMRTNAACYD